MKKFKNSLKEQYIYVLLNSSYKVKIGITTNFEQRLKSLSGSNCGGEKIIKYYCSPSTYVYTLERTMHEKFNDYRINGTEWFQGVSFENVVNELKKLFASDSYKKCNELRKQMHKKEKVI